MLLARALYAVAVLPGFFAGFVPWVIAARDPWRGEGHHLGALAVGAGVGILFLTVREFFVTGRGTLAPWDPPRHLVAVGLYRYVRNPMYVGILLMILGAAAVTGSPLVAAYAVLVLTIVHLRVVFYEERVLARQFPEEWAAYSAKVARWLPRWPRL
jgi:protein-S-isoprenylcysteine O-methyltransferase Ste14